MLTSSANSPGFTGLYSYLGERIDGTAADVWPRIAEKESWIVDSDVPWEAIARGEPEHNFIFGQAALSEAGFVPGLIDSVVAKPLDNVFTIEAQWFGARRIIIIERLGSTLAFKFGGRMSQKEERSVHRSERTNDFDIQERKRQRVLAHAGRDPKALTAALQGMKADACRNFVLAGELALAAYAVLLAESKHAPDKSQLQLFEQNDPKTFHAADLIQEALFLGAGVFSADAPEVGQIAELLGIPHRTR